MLFGHDRKSRGVCLKTIVKLKANRNFERGLSGSGGFFGLNPFLSAKSARFAFKIRYDFGQFGVLRQTPMLFRVH